MSGADNGGAASAQDGGDEFVDVDVIDPDMHEVKELTPEEWVDAKVTVPSVTETRAFGRTALKHFFNVHVNGSFYRGYRYSEIHKLRETLRKIDAAHCKAAPKFPEKSIMKALGGSSAKEVETRRTLFGPWLNHVSKSVKITSSEAWQKFAMLKPDYSEIEEELNTKVVDLEKLGDADWTETANKKGVRVSTLRQEDSKVHVVRTEVTVATAMANVLETYNTKSEWINWQPDLKVCKTIELLEGETELSLPCREVMYALYRVPVIQNRDVCLYNQRYTGTPSNRDAHGAATSLSISIQHPSCPQVKGVVRGVLNVGMTIFREVDDGKACSITSILHMDPRGLIPPAVINAMAATTVSTIVAMQHYIEKKYRGAK